MDETGKKTVSLGDIIKANLISSAIINGVKALANGLKTLATAAVGVGSDFESGMSQVAATMGITTEEIAAGSEEFDKLQKAAKEAGATTQFSATQAAEALNYGMGLAYRKIPGYHIIFNRRKIRRTVRGSVSKV